MHYLHTCEYHAIMRATLKNPETCHCHKYLPLLIWAEMLLGGETSVTHIYRVRYSRICTLHYEMCHAPSILTHPVQKQMSHIYIYISLTSNALYVKLCVYISTCVYVYIYVWVCLTKTGRMSALQWSAFLCIILNLIILETNVVVVFYLPLHSVWI